jgi:hypothetical protein
MSRADFILNPAHQSRFTSNAFAIQTRVTPHKKPNPFWRDLNSAPSEVVYIHGGTSQAK